jgi:hypothetical protein
MRGLILRHLPLMTVFRKCLNSEWAGRFLNSYGLLLLERNNMRNIDFSDQRTYSNNPGNQLKLALQELDGIRNVGTGHIFYVDSNVVNEGDGSSWDNALATIDEAIGKCVADRGDIIYVAQGHQETEAAAATSLFTLDVAGVSLIGVGNGANYSVVASGVATTLNRPTLIIDKADATITISAANCRMSGFNIISDIDNVAVGVTVAATADGFIFDNNVFKDNANNLDFLVMISVAAAAQNVQILNNYFYTTAAAGGNNAILLAGANTGLVVSGNVSFGKFATGCLLGSAAAQVSALITDNIFVNAEAAVAIQLHTSSTGILARNCLGGTTSIAAALVGDNAMWCFENYVTGAVAASGLLDPTADSDL